MTPIPFPLQIPWNEKLVDFGDRIANMTHRNLNLRGGSTKSIDVSKGGGSVHIHSKSFSMRNQGACSMGGSMYHHPLFDACDASLTELKAVLKVYLNILSIIGELVSLQLSHLCGVGQTFLR